MIESLFKSLMVRSDKLLFLVLISITPALAHSAEAVRVYDWMTADSISGRLKVVIAGDGTRVADFEFNDRGRGPKLHEVLVLDEQGYPLSLQVNGNSYMGAPVDERFEVQGGQAVWNSTLEQGSALSGGFYWANEGSLEQLAALVRAVINSESGSVDLYPAGMARINRVAGLDLPPDQGGPVSLYAVTGLGMEPTYIWLDENRELFALAAGWMGMVPQGQGALLPQLQTIQDQAEDNWHRELAATLIKVLPEVWLVKNVTVVDVEQGALLPGSVVLVRNGMIENVLQGEAAKQLAAEGDGLLVIDGGGRYLVPGLWDMHAHLSMGDGLLNIAAGVTTARDLANTPARLAEVRMAFDSNQVIGPRSYVAGFIDKKSPYSAPTGNLAESLEDALRLVDEYAAMGYPQIKIYSSIEPEWVLPIANQVHQHGMRLSGHIPSYMTAEQAVNDGFDEIQHINMLFLNFLAGPEDDTRTPVRFSLVAEQGGSLDLDSQQVQEFIALLKAKGIVVDPTVAIFDSMFRHRSGEIDPGFAAVYDHMPPSVQRGMMAGEMDIDESNAERYAASAQALLGLILRLHRAGVPLVAGTDNLVGFTLHRELELYQHAGISAPDVLKIATIGSAEVVGSAATEGSIAAGKNADFMLLNDNPLENINAVRAPVAVFKGDRQYDPARLYQAVGIRPFVSSGLE